MKRRHWLALGVGVVLVVGWASLPVTERVLTLAWAFPLGVLGGAMYLEAIGEGRPMPWAYDIWSGDVRTLTAAATSHLHNELADDWNAWRSDQMARKTAVAIAETVLALGLIVRTVCHGTAFMVNRPSSLDDDPEISFTLGLGPAVAIDMTLGEEVSIRAFTWTMGIFAYLFHPPLNWGFPAEVEVGLRLLFAANWLVLVGDPVAMAIHRSRSGREPTPSATPTGDTS